MSGQPASAFRVSWISQGFEHLVSRARKLEEPPTFDVLIIGSGYGGAVAADTFAGRTQDGKKLSVAVLERGSEYLPGSFPTGLAELPKHIRGERRKNGLFDVRLGKDVITLVPNGLGGGSLINAGVMETPLPRVFEEGWPIALKDASSWKSYYDRASEMLGARIEGKSNTITAHPDGAPTKYHALEQIAPDDSFRSAAITVSMSKSKSCADVEMETCVQCGDCATGCNFGAKISLDVGLLARAHQNGAEMFTGATVLDIAPDAIGGWVARCVYTDTALRDRDGEIVKIHAKKLILASGTLGSNEILMRSRGHGISLSDRLGSKCSTNGDMLVTDYATDASVRSVADEKVKPSQRAIGPTITGIVDLRETEGVLIEEMAVPAALGLAFREIFSSVSSLHAIDDIDLSPHHTGFLSKDPYHASQRDVDHTALYAIMSDDGADGFIELDEDVSSDRDGIAVMHWDQKDGPPLDASTDYFATLLRVTGGRFIPNPVWRLLPAKLSWLLDNRRGPPTTVHPLGGCNMADSSDFGVVDHIGRVFKGSDTDQVYPDLVVLDGSIIPTALGTNPALTIAALALRASETLATEWGFEPATVRREGKSRKRPVFRDTDEAATPDKTEVEVLERLVGKVPLLLKNSDEHPYIVELTLRFLPKELEKLLPGEREPPLLTLAADNETISKQSRIRIYRLDDWEQLNRSWNAAAKKEQLCEEQAIFKAPLIGTLRILERQRSSFFGRVWKGGKAWLLNRGMRDIYQAIADRDGGAKNPFSLIRSAIAVASHAGEVRGLRYELQVGTPDRESSLELESNVVVGQKTFTYDRKCNPWRQLMEVTLQEFPNMKKRSKPATLSLDLGYLAQIETPLFRITKQENGVIALSDLVSFLGYFLRMLVGIHIWSFRAPDRYKDGAPTNFLPPQKLRVPDGTLVTGVSRTIKVECVAPELGGKPVCARVQITRYPQTKENRDKRPVVMIHGYSAGGTTFAHDKVEPNFASYLSGSGRDVWIADLRTSPANERTAKKNWSFDQIASDVSRVVAEAAKHSVDGKVDVVAHCMGAVAFSIAALRGELENPNPMDPDSPGYVSKAAFTQVGPLVVFTPANRFRAFMIRYLVNYFPDTYEFNPSETTLTGDLLDRVLSTLPYPVEEFEIENPLLPWIRTPWTRTRHRMDALYGRVLNAAKMDPEVLHHINEHFGALSLRTAATTQHFVRYALMTNAKGKNQYVSRGKFEKYWNFPTRNFNGALNGLAHVSTADRMEKILKDSGRVIPDSFVLENAGHQDALIGTDRETMFEEVRKYLDLEDRGEFKAAEENRTVYPPWIGPVITEEPDKTGLVVRLGAIPSHRKSEGVVMLRVSYKDGQVLRPDDPTQPWDFQYIADHMVVHQSNISGSDGGQDPDYEEAAWDKFEVPPGMRGFDSAHAGNALLVLMVYDETQLLRSLAASHFYFRFVPGTRDVEMLKIEYAGSIDRSDGVYERIGIDTSEQIQNFLTNVAQTANGLLQTRGRPRSDAANRSNYWPGQTARDPRSTGNDPKSRAMQASAVLEELLASDHSLRDGVIPYDSPEIRPNEPDPNGTMFALASCQYPASPIDRKAAFRSFTKLGDRLESSKGIVPRFLILAGDQVYVDPTAGLYDPTAADDRYRLPYEAWLHQPEVRNIFRQVPSFMLLDDHEIVDNWEPIDHGNPEKSDENSRNKDLGFKAFNKYQRGLNHDLREFVFDGFHFFMLDTRTTRDQRKIGAAEAPQLVQQETMDQLKQWLIEKPGPKFVITPVMLLPRHRRAVQGDSRLSVQNLSAVHSDGWDGYPDTMRRLLNFIARKRIKHLVFLSGDEHFACIAKGELRSDAGEVITTIHSIHTAAMYAPFPFANGIAEDFVDEETIAIEDDDQTQTCVCDVTMQHIGPKDGPTYLSVRKSEGDWTIDCEFGSGETRRITL